MVAAVFTIADKVTSFRLAFAAPWIAIVCFAAGIFYFEPEKIKKLKCYEFIHVLFKFCVFILAVLGVTWFASCVLAANGTNAYDGRVSCYDYDDEGCLLEPWVCVL